MFKPIQVVEDPFSLIYHNNPPTANMQASAKSNYCPLHMVVKGPKRSHSIDYMIQMKMITSLGCYWTKTEIEGQKLS